jgi:hypothetical protein
MRSRPRTQRNMFALAGWLFADMFLAMTMIFLLGSTIGTHVPKVKPITPTPALIGMDKTPITVNFTVDPNFAVDSNGLLNTDPGVVAQVQSEVRRQLRNYLSTHNNGKAAFVSTFGGGTDDQIDTNEANTINTILQNMGKRQHYVFDSSDTVYNHYIDRSADFGNISIDIFFYLYTH